MDLIAYKTMPQWGADDLPKAFLQHHNTKSGTWGHVQVLQGELMYYAMDEAGNILSETRLNPQNTPLFVEPQAWHKVAPLSEDMRMQLSFYCEKSDYFTKKYGGQTYARYRAAMHSAGFRLRTGAQCPAAELDGLSRQGCGLSARRRGEHRASCRGDAIAAEYRRL